MLRRNLPILDEVHLELPHAGPQEPLARDLDPHLLVDK